MSNGNYRELYSQKVNEGLRSILDVISQYYADEHNVSVDSDTLFDYLCDTPVKSTTTRNRSTARNSTGRSRGSTSTNSSTVSGRGRGRSKSGAKKEDPVVNELTGPVKPKDDTHRHYTQGQVKGYCTYIISRGKYEDHICSKQAVQGTRCKDCAKKKGNDAKIVSGGEVEEHNVTDKGRAHGNFSEAVPDEDEILSISLVQYEDSDVLFTTENGNPHLLVTYRDPDDEESLVVIGQLDESGRIVHLKDDGIKQSNIINVNVDETILDKLVEKELVKVEESSSPSKKKEKAEEEDEKEEDEKEEDDEDSVPSNERPTFPSRNGSTRGPSRPSQRNARAVINI